MISLPNLAARIDKLGLMQKAFFDLTQAEIEALCQAVLDSVDTDCPWLYVCKQIPSYISKCKGPDKCQRAIYFAQNSIPKKKNCYLVKF